MILENVALCLKRSGRCVDGSEGLTWGHEAGAAVVWVFSRVVTLDSRTRMRALMSSISGTDDAQNIWMKISHGRTPHHFVSVIEYSMYRE